VTVEDTVVMAEDAAVEDAEVEDAEVVAVEST